MALTLSSLLVLAAALPPATSAAPPRFWEVGPGSGGGEVNIPRGIAVNRDNGRLFVIEQANGRVSEFTAWGEFVKTWGWDVVETGPGDDTVAPEDEFEICVPADDDVCQAGIHDTSGVGQFNIAASIGVDSGGNVYVFDGPAKRVQKFSPAGQFLLMFGGGVNQGPNNPGNICTAADIAAGDTCGAGTTGAADGQFGAVEAVSNLVAIGADDKVYVGDVGRIQRFNTAGEHQANMTIAGETVRNLAVDLGGNLYAAYRQSGSASEPNVVKLAPVDGAAGAPLASFESTNPRGLAVASDGDVYVFNNGGFEAGVRILHFDPSGELKGTIPDEDESSDFNSGSTGLAVNNCNTAENSIYHSNSSSPSFVRAFSEPPDPDVCGLPPEVPPVIDSQYAVAVETESARLGASIDPKFWEDTVYYVQYGTVDCVDADGWEAACVQASPAPPGNPLNSSVPVGAAPLTVSGLLPETEYLYRFVAESSVGGPVRGVGGTETVDGSDATFRTFPSPSAHKTNCPNQSFRTGASAHLTDCRAYELVSPLDKAGRDVGGVLFNSLQQSASDGDALTYSTGRAFADPQGSPLINQYLARRDPSEGRWVNEALAPPREGPSAVGGITEQESHYKAFSDDLCLAWNFDATEPKLAPGALAGLPNLYRRDNCGPGNGTFEALTTVHPPDIERGQVFLPAIQGFSADGSISVFRAAGQLRGDLALCPPEKESNNTCERRVYAVQGGELDLASVLPDGTPSPAPANSVGTTGGQEGEHLRSSVYRAVSADGSRVYWSAGSGALYVRLNPTANSESPPDSEGNCVPDPVLACTLEIAKGSNVRFWGAAQDGHKAIYSVGLLTGAGAQLFEFDLATQTSDLIAGGVRGVAGISDDASRLYFGSHQVLTPLPNSEGEVAQADMPNLYYYEAGEGVGPDSFAFIGTLSERDLTQPNSFSPSPLHASPPGRTARVNGDGSHLAFTSRAALTGYDNTDLASGEADDEVFLYSAESGDLVCVSCNPSGARPSGRLVFHGSEGELWSAATIPGWSYQLHPSRALSEDGGRLFFESFDALVLADTNGKKDVYEWEAVEVEGEQGSRECEELGAELHVEASGGCLSLISSGTSPQDSDFLDASPDGRDVFFRTASSLLSHDFGLRDFYNARENGGLPVPASPVPPCEGEACQSPPPPPAEVTPASAAFQGPGNPPAGRSCSQGRRAAALARAAKRSRRAASRARSAQGKRKLRSRAADKARKAKRMNRAAQRCRRQNRRAAR